MTFKAQHTNALLKIQMPPTLVLPLFLFFSWMLTYVPHLFLSNNLLLHQLAIFFLFLG